MSVSVKLEEEVDLSPVNDIGGKKKKKGKEQMDMALLMSDVVPFAAMVIVECVSVGISTISKAAMNGGLSSFVLVVYSDALGTLILFPFFIFNRLYFSLSLCIKPLVMHIYTYMYMVSTTEGLFLLQEQTPSSYFQTTL